MVILHLLSFFLFLFFHSLTEAHSRNLSIGLKNDVEQIDQLESYFDWAMSESCLKYHECHYFKRFIQNNKVSYIFVLIDLCCSLVLFCYNNRGKTGTGSARGKERGENSNQINICIYLYKTVRNAYT